MRISNIRKEFGSVIAVNGVSFTIEKPEFIGIIGRSGAGKSTLLRMINRLIDSTDGEVEFEGTNVLSLSGRAKRDWQRNCAMIFQQFNLIPRLDAITNVMLGRLNQLNLLRSFFRIFPEKDIADALTNLERLDIADKALTRVEHLSGGQQQRVALARALVRKPKMLLADEPTGNLDKKNTTNIIDILIQLCKENKSTLIMVTHDNDLLTKFDQTYTIESGKIL